MNEVSTLLWDAPIDKAGLPTRTVNALRNDGFSMLSEVADKGRSWILRTPGLGKKGCDELFAVIAQRKEGQLQQAQAASNVPLHKNMTLRDYFAGQAMASIIAVTGTTASSRQMTARDAYAAADAMLAAREVEQ